MSISHGARRGVALTAMLLVWSAQVDAGVITGVTGVEVVARLTGPGAINNTSQVAIGGTDLGHMVNHAGRTYFLFGDTFSGDTPAAGGMWRSNVMAYSTDANPANGITFDGWLTNSQGRAREVIHSGRTNPITEIPTGAVSIGDRIYAWYMAVNWWGPPGQWTANYSGLAYWQEGDATFTVVDDFELPGNGNFGMVTASFRTDVPPETDDHLYVWGTPAGRLGGVKLARVDPNSVEDAASYQYFGGLSGGEPTWISNEFASPLIVPSTVGEMSVMYNEALQNWTMLYLSDENYAIEIRQAPDPWGPWSEPLTVMSGWDYWGLYGSYMNPLYVEDDGKTFYFTVSFWDDYDVFLAKATLTIDYEGDFNGDGVVDGADFLLWQRGESPRGLSAADLVEWKADFGIPAVPAQSPVPEPTGVALALVAACAVGRRLASLSKGHILLLRMNASA